MGNGCNGVEDNSGEVWILFMNHNGTVKQGRLISSAGVLPLQSNDRFGYSVSWVSDLDGDGIPDLAVGPPGMILKYDDLSS